MAKLAHNDYLEQASDSGIPGGLAFVIAIWGMIILLRPSERTSHLEAALWLGLLGWALQAFIEFGLYIPALAWPAFFFFGTLWGTREQAVKV